jgi:PAS domain S-box-containing protein
MEGATRHVFHIADVLRDMSDAVITVDAERRITSMNAAAELMLGVTEAEALGAECDALIRSDIRFNHCAFEAVWERGETAVNFNVALENRLGEKLPVSISTSLLKNSAGDPVGLIHAIRDLRPVLRLIDALRQSQHVVTQKDLEVRLLRQEDRRLENILGHSQKMQEIFELIRVMRASDVTVLLQGESGTGKELIASTIHAVSHRNQGPFIKVSCAALPEGVLESELFGHVKGAFTGAIRDKPGRFELANRGTIFLDEVAEMTPSTQVKLLRVLQEREFERVGGTRTIRVDVRVIAATNLNLQKAVQDGRFREDLFYRLNVVPIVVPPLRERKEDVPFLVGRILEKLARKTQRPVLHVSPDAMRVLIDYDWPGNVRELENALEFALVRTRGDTIPLDSLPPWIGRSREAPNGVETPLSTIVEKSEREQIIRALVVCGGKVSEAARALGVGRTTLWRKIKRYRIGKV